MATHAEKFGLGVTSEDGLVIGTLPDWGYAGKPREGVVVHKEQEVDGKPHVVLPSARPQVHGDDEGTRHVLHEYVVESVAGIRGAGEYAQRSYLIPLYQEKEQSYHRREERLLVKRVRRFFYSCQPGLDVPRTAQEITAELALFQKELAALNARRTNQNPPLPKVDLSKPPEMLTQEERLLVAQGAQFVGHAVNRLGRLGQIILQKNRVGIDFEQNDAYVQTQMPAIKDEFSQLYTTLAYTSPELVRCVRSRDHTYDYDGVFADLIREIGKPVMSSLFEEQAVTDGAPTEAERSVRQNIASKIGQTLDAIDEVFANLLPLTQHPSFGKLVQQIKQERTQRLQVLETTQNRTAEQEAALTALRVNELDVTNYRGFLREFADICRARACIRGDDADNFTPVATRFEFLKTELKLLHQTFLEHDRSYPRGRQAQKSVSIEASMALLQKGVDLMAEMAELRMPRNHSAFIEIKPEQRQNPAFIENDPSSVGQLKRAIRDHVQALQQQPSTHAGTLSGNYTYRPAAHSR